MDQPCTPHQCQVPTQPKIGFIPDSINISPLLHSSQRVHQETATARFHALVDVTSTTAKATGTES